MFNFTIRIDKITLPYLIEYLGESKDNISKLANEIKGTKEENETQMVIRINDSNAVKVIVITHAGQVAEHITLYGKFHVKLNDLLERYLRCRKVYVPYDDNFEFFFNEDSKEGDYVLKVFTDRTTYEKEENFELHNLHLRW